MLAAADAYHAMTEPRPHRPAVPPAGGRRSSPARRGPGRLDAEAVAAAVEAAGQRAPRLERAAGLTEREAQVVAMLARGLQTKQVARALGISVKTADHHVQNAYRKIGVSSRAAATLFAMEHGLVAWGELPMARPGAAFLASSSSHRPRRYMMSSETIFDVAEAIAPTWERRRADVEELVGPGARVDAARAGAPRGRHRARARRRASATPASTPRRRLGERGRLITSDFSPAMLAAARRRGAERGVANAEYRIVDAERIELDEDSVDGVLCRFGYMLMDSRAALAGTRRVLRPGGRVALAVWGALERNPWMAILGFPLTERGHIPAPEPPPAPGPFSMASAERTTALLRDAGFTEVRTEELPVRWRYRTWTSTSPWSGTRPARSRSRCAGSPRPTARTCGRTSRISLGRFTAANGYELPGVALCAVAR